jgi:hypothetical protein
VKNRRMLKSWIGRKSSSYVVSYDPVGDLVVIGLTVELFILYEQTIATT